MEAIYKEGGSNGLAEGKEAIKAREEIKGSESKRIPVVLYTFQQEGADKCTREPNKQGQLICGDRGSGNYRDALWLHGILIWIRALQSGREELYFLF